MLCCGGKKDSGGRDMKSAHNTPSRQPLAPPGGLAPPPLHQSARQNVVGGGDFKKVSGISNEIFRQIETVENRYDQSTAEAFRTVQKSGEMVVRKLDPREFIRLASETASKINVNTNDPDSATSFVEIVKRPGQTLGLYIREGNGMDRSDGVFVSRIALESAVYSSECIVVGDEILAVNLVDVTRMSLDDVVIIMSIPRRLVLTTRRQKGLGGGGAVVAGGGSMNRYPPGNARAVGMDHHKSSNNPVVVFKGDPDQTGDFGFRSDYRDGFGSPGGGMRPGHHSAVPLPIRDSRTLTWDRNPKPDRNDPKYFPVNSLPRQPRGPAPPIGANVSGGSIMSPPRDDWSVSGPVLRPQGLGPPGTGGGEYHAGQMGGGGQAAYLPPNRPGGGTGDPYGAGVNGTRGGDMPPPMHALPSYQPPPPVVTEQPRTQKEPTHFRPYRHTYNGLQGKFSGGAGPTGPAFRSTGESGVDIYSPSYSLDPPSTGTAGGYPGIRGPSRLAEPSPLYPSSSTDYRKLGSVPPRKSYTLGSWRGGGRSLDYASDTDVVQSPPRSVRSGRLRSGAHSRSNSLPRTFNREALLRHPELSMEIDRLSDTMSEVGERLSVLHSQRGTSPSSFSTMGDFLNPQDLVKRTPSTSAIYETLRRSKELRESLSRPGSRLSIENLPEKVKEPDLHYYSDSEHQSVPRQELRRLRNRTLSGLDSLRLGEQSRERSHSLSIPGLPAVRTPCTPTFATEKDAITNFVDFNPADFVKYKIDRYSETAEIRLSGSLNLHLLSGRGLKATGRYKRFRDLYCVVEVDHVHKARTVVRSGGLNFDWDERFQLDLLNNMEVEFLIYSWDPQLRHRLCYRTSLRLGNLFATGQHFQQISLRLQPAGLLYLTLRYTTLRDTYNRSTNTLQPGRLFGVSLESVIEQENSGFLVPLLVRRCIMEVEKRGLDIIGLYRLCGSETKKKMLREAFESNPETVDLSSENVPDINVITSLLKEYLRELPEPLFSSCLYQMLVDAVGVFLPNDPDGNAKLVFSILDCLPKANRNCLVQIVDHLAAVTSQATRNKMNAHNLAICFAPVLMLDTSDSLDQEEPAIVQQLQILKYLIEIWPKSHDNL